MQEMERLPYSCRLSKIEEGMLWDIKQYRREFKIDNRGQSRKYDYEVKFYELGEKVTFSERKKGIWGLLIKNGAVIHPFECSGPDGGGRALIYIPFNDKIENSVIDKGFYAVQRNTFGRSQKGIELVRKLAQYDLLLSTGTGWKFMLTTTKFLGYKVLEDPRKLGFKVGDKYDFIFAEFPFRITFELRPERYPDLQQ